MCSRSKTPGKILFTVSQWHQPVWIAFKTTTLAYIHENIQQNDETTATDLQKVLHKETGTLISLSTIKRARSKLGWVQTGVKYCQLIRLQNKVKRLNFALKCLQTQDDFKDVIFTNESTAAIG